MVSAIGAANGVEDRFDGPGVDSDAELHRSTYFEVFADAGLDEDLAAALYAVEADYRHNVFAADAQATLADLHGRGIRLAIVSDIHFDLRPAFAAANMGDLIDVFTLSYEQGTQKPDPAMFTDTVGRLGSTPRTTLMVGDRSGPDGAAVEQGIVTLLLPPLRSPTDLRLHLVSSLVSR